MSYLLDALRKAERERHLDRVPDLAQLHEPDADTRRGGLPGWVVPAVAVLVLLNLGALSAFWLLREPEGTTPKNEAVSQTLPGGRPDRPAGASAARTAATEPTGMYSRRTPQRGPDHPTARPPTPHNR